MRRGANGSFWFSKWPLAAGWWVVQSVLISGLATLWAISASNTSKTTPLGSVSWQEFIDAANQRDWVVWCVLMCAGIAGAQAVFLWPVRKPMPKQTRGWGLWVSLGVAGLAITGLLAGVVMTFTHAIDLLLLRPASLDWNTFVPGAYRSAGWYLVGACVVSWCVFTPLLIVFCKRGPRESLLARLSARLLLGTVIEVVAIIPLDVMIRRRESCYCLAGTYFALSVCGAVAVFVIGPVVLLPVLARRRKRWFMNKCDACGYDMSGCLGAPKCPECGSGWRVPA